VIGTEGWIGIVSLEDVLEELVGDIRDETDGYSAGEIDPSTTSA
jgi:CBS domain containing-hemolysin-like protein